ncbi:MAG: glycoside hydrolase family 18 protein [Cellulosilyticaceae bacterium]
MPRFPMLGHKISNIRGISSHGVVQLYDISNKWVVVCACPNTMRSTSSNLAAYYRTLATQNIEVLTTKSSTSNTSIYIIDPTYTVRAVLHNTPGTPISESNIQHILDSLQTSYRPEIQGVSNQPTNPNCPNYEKLVGEYVLGNPKNVDPLLNDFLIYAFALIQPGGTLEVYSEKYLQDLADLRYANPNLDVIMAIGGWGNDGFSDAALTPKSRYDFAREVKKWVDEYDLDGVDIDWEYPGSSASGIKSRPEDRENFTLLLQALREVLGPDAWISVAGIGDNAYIKNVDIAGIAPIIDYFNVMSYDFTAGATGAQGAKHQSNLYNSDLALNNISTDLYIQNLIEAGMPPEKILMGIGFYGRNGAKVTKTFDEIRKSYINKGGYKVKWDNVAKAPYIVDKYGNFFLSFDNALSIYFKGQYIDQNCLAGMFGWQAGMDQANILINSMYLAMNDPSELEKVLSKAYYGK